MWQPETCHALVSPLKIREGPLTGSLSPEDSPVRIHGEGEKPQAAIMPDCTRA
ncbi:hypothetical protein [uncultured Methanoregula sp.]|uniref:hypothetical protein n=1 Tax=uncultured Methanoregula sp. TaxID=1005933 RepID=UPI002AAB2E68|nr:hypothetical protein [uncultured Methanoregula sp.]